MVKQPGKKILRVGLFQNERFLEERLMRTAATVTVGHDLKKNTLIVPASDLPRSFELFKYEKEQYVLQFTAGMEGKVVRSAESGVETFEELRRSGVAKKKGDVYQVSLSQESRGRIALGDAAVVFRFMTPPPVRPMPVLPASMRGGLIQGLDGPFALFVVLSILLQVGFVIFLELNDWPVEEYTELRIPDRMARIMIPQKEEEPEIELEPELVEGEGEEGEGEAVEEEPAPAEAPERTPEQVAEERSAERQEVTARVENTTILGTLTAQGEDGQSSIQRLIGNVGDISIEEAFDGTSRVVTDSGISTDRLGRGGSGSPDAGGGGGMVEGSELGELGGVDGRVDTGQREEQRVETVKVDVGLDPPGDMIGGTLDTQALMRALGQLRNNIEACYRDYLRTNPQARGSVRVLITVTARGSRGVIDRADVAADEVSGGRVGQCISNQLTRGRVRLPAPEDGDVQVTVPYHFSPG